ncbi:MAG: DivIVA domain-containing protein [Nostocoides sp.]
MALTPEEVLNKTFTTTQFRRGYDEREVDDFLDDVVAEMRRQTKENDDLLGQLSDCRGSGRPGTSTANHNGGGVQMAAAQAEIERLEVRNRELEQLATQYEERIAGLDGSQGDLRTQHESTQTELGRLREEHAKLQQTHAALVSETQARNNQDERGEPDTSGFDQRIADAQSRAEAAEKAAEERITAAVAKADDAEHQASTRVAEAEKAAQERLEAANRQVEEAEHPAQGHQNAAPAAFAGAAAGDGAASGAGLLALAQQVHDEHIAAGEAKRDELINSATTQRNQMLATATVQRDEMLATATNQRDEMLTEARERSTGMVAEAQQKKAAILAELGQQQDALKGRIEQLKGFERNYRGAIKGFIKDQLTKLDETSIDHSAEADQALAGKD